MQKQILRLFIILLSFLNSQNIFAQQITPSISKNIVHETNEFRKSNGLPTLISTIELDVIAQKHSADMAKKQVEFGHEGFGERSQKAKKVLKEMKGNFAENVAYGPTTAKEVVRNWKDSPGHRRNMLGNYKYIGIGIASDKQGRLYYTQIFAL